MTIDPTTMRMLYVRHVVTTATGALGPAISMAFARWLARGVFDLNSPVRQRAERNVDLAMGPELSRERREEIVRSMYEHLAAFWVEALLARRKLRPSSWRHRVTVENESRLRAAAEDPRGVLFTTAYFGSPALLAYALGQICRPIHVVIDEVEHPILRSWQSELYRQPNIEPIPVRLALRRLPTVLAGGGKVLILGEHGRRRGRAIEVPYLGRVCRCFPTVAVLARWCDVPVWWAVGRRMDWDQRFMVQAGAVADPRTVPDTTEAEATITERYMAALERVVLRWPEQYFWSRVWAGSALDAEAEVSKAHGPILAG